ncbi:MAG TPA: LuxR C-terminal-related transcriptional regulator [Streptosporangiaceae bacterium]|jgi:non-specific serine/threonine protein kinase|nr:LuxR C-terminal-related transcriptional regulator [Streptosporangiaceae bacterium]
MAPRARVTGNLPAELTSFVGRRGELAEVKRLLAGSRLVTLTGVGGVGKTRLALRAAAGLRRAFRDGVWLVQLDQLRDPALVAQAVAGALDVQDRAGYAPAASLAEFLARRQLLLVLDNCEHLVDAAAKLAEQLLRAAAGLRVLATSREALNIDGEMVLPVPPLPVPEAGQPLTAAAVRFFAERAAQAVPGFAVTEANMAAVAEICRRLEGLPLALELAAARLPVLSPEQIDARLGDRLGLLTRGSRTRPARQQTLRASIEWSYELCSQAERLLWARLSVFAGGFELDAAESICADHRLADGEVLELLAALADKSILIAAHGKGVVRYRLLETLREYGQERLQESGEYTALRRRHRDWHEQLARCADTGWLSPQIADWTDRLFREHANMQAAQDFCQAEPGEAEAGLRIALHVWFFHCWIAGHVSEGRYRLGQALARAREPTMWRAQGLLLASFLAAVGGDRGAVQPLLEQGTSLAGQLNDPATQAFAAWVAGHVCLFAGDLPQAIAHSEDGLAVLPAAVGGRQRAHLLICLANAAGLAGDEERAVACHRELAALTEAGSDYIRSAYSAYSLWALGAAAWRLGDLDRATELQQESLRLRRNDRMGSTYCMEALAWIAASRHQYERAAVLLGAVTGLLQSMGTTLDGNEYVAGHHQGCERQARQALGEAAFQAAYHRGLELYAADVLAYALQQPLARPPEKPSKPAVSEGAPLTPRELQVARLIAAGRSNKDIAAGLVISQRTAENHVEHILTKLGFTSRAQVAAWVAQSPTGQ